MQQQDLYLCAVNAFTCFNTTLFHYFYEVDVIPDYLAPQLSPAVECLSTDIPPYPTPLGSLPRQLRINFNITMLELPCDYASVDVLDLLGTNKVNMTKNIVKVRVGMRPRSLPVPRCCRILDYSNSPPFGHFVSCTT